MEGGDLVTLLRSVQEGYFSEEELLHSCACISDAMAYLERRSIVHRVSEDDRTAPLRLSALREIVEGSYEASGRSVEGCLLLQCLLHRAERPLGLFEVIS